MKYLRKYSDSLLEQQSISFEQGLIDFCESNLVYLLDEGMKIISRSFPKDIEIQLGFREIGGIEWNDIKDYIIPFFDRLSKEYTLKETTRIISCSKVMYQIQMYISPEGESGVFESTHTIDDIISESNSLGKSRERYLIKSIKFYIKR